MELPTETWPAHDVRKSHILHLAARHSPRMNTAGTQPGGDYFSHPCGTSCSFPTAFLTREHVILCVYGHVHAYLAGAVRTPESRLRRVDTTSDGRDQGVPQNQRLGATLAANLGSMGRHLGHATLG